LGETPVDKRTRIFPSKSKKVEHKETLQGTRKGNVIVFGGLLRKWNIGGG